MCPILQAAADSRQAWALLIAYAPWVLILVVFWWLLERGQQKR